MAQNLDPIHGQFFGGFQVQFLEGVTAGNCNHVFEVETLRLSDLD